MMWQFYLLQRVRHFLTKMQAENFALELHGMSAAQVHEDNLNLREYRKGYTDTYQHMFVHA